ncbi:MAG: thermonuclease family protein [Candidatus Omnitrophica bacterium]|nr:thermonuclease family protein [Candidatus Omnitrophota bacterium]
MPKVPVVARFNKLVDDISRFVEDARRVQLQFAWETGRLIVVEEQNGEMRAAYGKELIPKLAKELTRKYGPGFSDTNLRKMRHFYLLHPKQATSPELDWSDYAELLPIKDEKTRKRLEQRILKEDLKSVEIRQLVRRVRDLPKPSAKLPPLKRPADLRLDTFSISPLRTKLKDNEVLIDCGFFVNWPMKKEGLKGLDLTGEMSYTYAASIDRVIDGDTLLVLIEAGFRVIVHDRLRLRGIDCPEVGTPAGDRAKRFVEKLLPAGSTIVLKSHKDRTDQHGRFVVDVFYKQGCDDAGTIIKDGTYLNQELLDKGYAVRMAE